MIRLIVLRKYCTLMYLTLCWGVVKIKINNTYNNCTDVFNLLKY